MVRCNVWQGAFRCILILRQKDHRANKSVWKHRQWSFLYRHIADKVRKPFKEMVHHFLKK